MFGQLNKCHSLREIVLWISQSPEFLYDIGLAQGSAKFTMSDGNEKRNYQVFEAIYQGLFILIVNSSNSAWTTKTISSAASKTTSFIKLLRSGNCLIMTTITSFWTRKSD